MHQQLIMVSGSSPGARKSTAVEGIDALGFVLGTALAVRAGTGFVPVRKAGKLPVPADRETFVDYSGQAKGLEVRRAPWPSDGVSSWWTSGSRRGRR